MQGKDTHLMLIWNNLCSIRAPYPSSFEVWSLLSLSNETETDILSRQRLTDRRSARIGIKTLMRQNCKVNRTGDVNLWDNLSIKNPLKTREKISRWVHFWATFCQAYIFLSLGPGVPSTVVGTFPSPGKKSKFLTKYFQFEFKLWNWHSIRVQTSSSIHHEEYPAHQEIWGRLQKQGDPPGQP